MIISGKVILGGRLLYFSRVETSDSLGWYLYDSVATINDREFTIDVNSLERFNHKGLKPFVVAAQLFSVEQSKFWGNPQLINSLMNVYNTVVGMKYDEETSSTEEIKQGILFRNIKTLNNYYFDTTELSTIDPLQDFSSGITNIFTNKDTAESGQIKKKTSGKNEMYSLNFRYKDTELETWYQTSGAFTKKIMDLNWQTVDLFEGNNREQQETILATRAKTLTQLRMTRDLSWYFDENGKTKKDYVVIDTLEMLKHYCDNVFPHLKMWCVDIESTGLNMFKGDKNLMDHTVSIMMSWKKDQAIFIPIDMMYMINIPEGWVELLKPWLESIPAVGHNISFDARGLFVDFGIKLFIKHDTMQLNFNINTHRAKFRNGLKYLEHKYLNVDTLELKEIFGTNKLAGLFRYLPQQLALIYACPDVDYCLQLFYLLYEQLPVSCRKAYKLDMDVMVYTYQMDCIGNRVDVERAKNYRIANNKDRDLLEDLIYKFVGQTLALKDKVEQVGSSLRYGYIDAEDGERELKEFIASKEYQDAKHKFKIGSSKELAKILFDLMKCPIQGISSKTKEPTVDATTLKKLMDIKVDSSESSGWLLHDIKSAQSELDPDVPPLISKNEFNSMKYPLALLIVEYRLRSKRDNTFFSQLLDKALGFMYYTGTKLASAETFRMINTIQVLQGFMKKLIIPFDDDYYMLVFDFSQIEYRYMAGMANVKTLVKQLNKMRADFHRECCALLHNKEPWFITSKQRKEGKSLNFAIPYGMGLLSICMQLFKIITIDTKILAQRQLNTWQEKFHLIWDFLELQRKFALDNGYVQSELGRRRYFFDCNPNEVTKEELEEWQASLTKGQKNSIRRASGNYPIQNGAADLFKIALIKFRKRLEKEGLADLVKSTGVIHDEILNSVHKSVNPYYLYRIIMEECMLIIKDHPRYYAGISIVDNWYEGKEDLYEAPMEFVQMMVDSDKSKEKFVYQHDAKNNVLNDIKAYMKETFIKELAEVKVDLNSKVQDLSHVLDNLQDYFIRDKMSVYYPLPKAKGKLDKNYDNDRFIRSFEEFLLLEGSLDSYEIIYPKDYPLGQHAIITSEGRTFVDSTGNVTKTQLFTTLTPDIKLDLTKDNTMEDMDLDMDLDFDNDDELAEDIRIEALKLFEAEEEESLFNTGEFFFYRDETGVNLKDEQEMIDANPEQYIHSYSTYNDKLRVTSGAIYIDFYMLSSDKRQEVLDYLNEFLVEKDVLGSVEIVIKIANQFDHTGRYIRDYDLGHLQNILSGISV